jgi:hypothetical protein
MLYSIFCTEYQLIVSLPSFMYTERGHQSLFGLYVDSLSRGRNGLAQKDDISCWQLVATSSVRSLSSVDEFIDP